MSVDRRWTRVSLERAKHLGGRALWRDGSSETKKYVGVDDCGSVVNQMIVS